MTEQEREALLAPETVVVVSSQQVSCELDGETAILQSASGVYYGLDPVGTRVWEMVQRPTTMQSIQAQMLEEFRVSATRLERDLTRLLRDLDAAGLVVLS